LDDLKK